jgi:hypothetical protein
MEIRTGKRRFRSLKGVLDAVSFLDSASTFGSYAPFYVRVREPGTGSVTIDCQSSERAADIAAHLRSHAEYTIEDVRRVRSKIANGIDLDEE